MDAGLRARQEYLQDVSSFVKFHEDNISKILSKIGWTEEKLLEDDKEITHGDESENEEDLPLAGPSREQQPIKSTEVIYEEIMADIPQKPQETKQMTWLELMAAERDLKRRRMSYKRKIHTKNKSHTEVMREVINQQMDALQGLEEEENLQKPITTEDEKHEDLVEVRLPRTCNPHSAWKSVHKYILDPNKIELEQSDDGYKDKRKENPHAMNKDSIYESYKSGHDYRGNKYRRRDNEKKSWNGSKQRYDSHRNINLEMRDETWERGKTSQNSDRPQIKRNQERRDYEDVKCDRMESERRREKGSRTSDLKLNENRRMHERMDNKPISLMQNSSVSLSKGHMQKPSNSFEHRTEHEGYHRESFKLTFKNESSEKREKHNIKTERSTSPYREKFHKSKRKRDVSPEDKACHKHRKKSKKYKKSKKHKRKPSRESDTSSSE